MTPRTVRRLVVLVFVAGIAGMIAGSIADNNGMAITFGLLTAAAAVGLILVTTVAGPGAFDKGARPTGAPHAAVPERVPMDEAEAAELEARINELVAGGADESAVRDLVRRAINIGRPTPSRGADAGR